MRFRGQISGPHLTIRRHERLREARFMSQNLRMGDDRGSDDERGSAMHSASRGVA